LGVFKCFSFAISLFLSQILFAQNPGEWVWIKGDSTPYSYGVWGIQGVSSPLNNPPALYEPCEWKDKDGNFWIYGGIGNGAGLSYSALWKYDLATNEWTWMRGPSDTVCYGGSWGIQGIPDPTNDPPTSSFVAASWVDTTGDLWMFQGGSCIPNWGGCMWNTMWCYNIASNQWTWMKGPNVPNDLGNYGVQGIPDTSNNPPARNECAATWVDDNNNLWLYGGIGRNDLWKYDIANNIWTWMKGNNSWNIPGVYGVIGIEDSLSNPGARGSYSHWKDAEGNFWLFGGLIYNSLNAYNDLWRYNLESNNWTWMKGSNSINANGSYGIKCISADQNIPGARYESKSCWTDSTGNFWFFGGAIGFNLFNDLWKYCPRSNQWTWINGGFNQTGSWGIKGFSDPNNHPSGRYGSVSWIDDNDQIYLFGGSGLGAIYNDLWAYKIDPVCDSCNCIDPVPNFSADNILICKGECVNFTSSVSPPAQFYQWTFENGIPGFSTEHNPPNICFDSTGWHTVSLTVSNYDCVNSISRVDYITVNLPDEPLISILGDTLISSLANSYQWYDDNGAIPNEIYRSFIAQQPGHYFVCVWDLYNCMNCSDTVSITSTLAREPLETNFEIEVSPNPFQSYLLITNLWKGLQPLNIIIRNILGEIMFEYKLNTIDLNDFVKIDLSFLSSGVYLMETSRGLERRTRKIIKL
jgi:PKD repeat protein